MMSAKTMVARVAELLRLLQERPPNARFYVAVQGEAAGQWRELKSLEANELVLKEGGRLSLQVVRAFIVTYGSGEILATSLPPPTKLPVGAFFARTTFQGSGATLSDKDIQEASRNVKVLFGEVRASQSRGNIYETRIHNQGPSPIRITEFGAYTKSGEEWTLNTIAEGFFTAQQFQDWYDVPGDGWLAPGASGVDRENYGSNCLWVYFFETPDGQKGMAIGKAPK